MRRCIFLLLGLSVAVAAHAQPANSLLSYLISADSSSWRIGGNLGVMRSSLLDLPSERTRNLTAGLAIRGGYADYYRTGAMESSGASFGREASGEMNLSGRWHVPWAFRMVSGEQRTRLDFESGVGHQSTSIAYDEWSSAAHIVAGNDRVRAGGGLRWGSQTSLEPTLGLQLAQPCWAAAEVSWSRRYPALDAHAVWSNETADVNLDGLRDAYSGRIGVQMCSPFRAEYRVTRGQWIRRTTDEINNRLEPWGDDWSHHSFLAYDAPRWTGLIGWRGLRGDLMAYGVRGTERFAKITQADWQADGVFLSFERRARETHREVIELERLDWQANARGHTEFWPFTSGWVDLLGMRRYFVADASGYIWRLHLAETRDVSRTWSGSLGLNLFDAHISSQLEHWRPEYLIFGKADVQQHELSLQRALATLVSLSVSWHPSAWEVCYTAQQLIPLRTWQRDAPSANDDNSLPDDGSVSRSFGGAFHEVTLSWNFD